MTEEEASKRFCPFLLIVWWMGKMPVREEPNCLGSKCMMWEESTIEGEGHCGLAK